MAPKPSPLDLPTFKQPAKPSTASSQGCPTPSQAPQNRPITLPNTKTRQTESAALPLLPKTKRLPFSSHRNDANAALALDLLADVEAAITEWHQALRQILLDIQALYSTGPIVEGWLESVAHSSNPTTVREESSVLRHGDAEQIAAYVENLSQVPPAAKSSNTTQYRLCRLDTDGQVQYQPCPPEQLGAVSQAIARYQQLRQLLDQKQYLEARLKRAAEALEATRKALDLTS